VTEEPKPKIKHAAHCTRCKAPLVLEQDPECPPLAVEKWLAIIVCNRCGKYLESYRRIDDAIAYICGQYVLAMRSKSAGEVKAALGEQLTRLTQEFNRILCKRWTTTGAWSYELVEMLLEHPDKTRIALRMEEKNHRRARENADRQKELV